MYSKVHMCKYLPHMIPIQTGLKQGCALSPLLFNSALQYAVRKVEDWYWLGHVLLIYGDAVTLLREYT
jgi:hypothetical protein